jgi:hypothetical protein
LDALYFSLAEHLATAELVKNAVGSGSGAAAGAGSVHLDKAVTEAPGSRGAFGGPKKCFPFCIFEKHIFVLTVVA